MMKKQNKKLPISVVKQLFSNKNLYASYLFVEKEMSLAQSDLGMIPKKSAKEISKKCNKILYFSGVFPRRAPGVDFGSIWK